jgi:hypothetical protein
LFADDAAFVALSENDAQELIRVVDEVCTAFGMELSKSKTEVMLQQRRLGKKIPDPKIYLLSQTGEKVYLKVVKEFKYLGIMISDDNCAKKDIDRRIKQAGVAFAKYKRTFMNKYISLSSKISLYLRMVITILLQCIGVRTLLKTDIDRLEAFHFRRVRIICGWSEVDFRSYNEVYEKAGITSISTMISGARIKWAARVYQMDDYRIPKLLVMRRTLVKFDDNYQHGTTSSHRTWYKCLQNDLKSFGMSMEDVMSKKRGEISVLLKEGSQRCEKEIREKRALAKQIKYNRNEGLADVKRKAQEQMRQKRALGIIAKKDERKTKKNKK